MVERPLNIVATSANVEALFAPLRPLVGADFEAYRNHVYRVLTYALHFLGGDETHRPAVETALVYHDIGLWSDRTLAYLEPSESAALNANKTLQLGHDPEMLRAMIHWHHKVFAYNGPHAREVNAVRRADWIDATQGRIRNGLTREQIDSVERAIPVLGFPQVLERLAADLNNGHKWGGLMRVVRRVYKL